MTFGGKKKDKVYSRNHSLRSRGDRPVAPTAQFGKSQIQNPDGAASGYIRATTLNVGSLEIRIQFNPMESASTYLIRKMLQLFRHSGMDLSLIHI